MSEKILFVDDDVNVLAALQRQLRKKFEVDTATDPELALQTLEANGPYAVIVSDMQMPRTNGVQFLGQVRERSPASVRVMLTGNADQQTAMDAVNRGAIFRFLTKPCATELLCDVLTAAIAQHRLMTAEKDILEKTLSGSVKLLTEILDLVNPIVFSRSARIRQVTREIARKLNLESTWQVEVASMLSQIGCITLTPQTLEAVHAGKSLPEDEAARYASHPAIAGKLLANIPRFEAVAQIVARQDEPFDAAASPGHPRDRDPTLAAAQTMKVAIHFDRLVATGLAPKVAIARLLKRSGEFDPIIVQALAAIHLTETDTELRDFKICDLPAGAILEEDVKTTTGAVLLTRGQTVTYAMLVRLRNFWARREICERLRVRLPVVSPQPARCEALSPNRSLTG